jgi:hypothetical protein
MASLDFALSSTDRFLYQKFRCHLTVEGKKSFCSDDFRACGLEKFLPYDPNDPSVRSNAIGLWFAKHVHQKKILEVGTTRSMIKSNHLRRISVYEFVEEAQK